MSKYWSNEGERQAEFTALTEELMPAVGAAATFGGEVIRAVNRLYYEAFNNGWGNNVSGALNFLREFFVGAAPAELRPQIREDIATLQPYVNPGHYVGDFGQSVNDALDRMCTNAVIWIKSDPDRAGLVNPVDMLELSDEDKRWHDEDDEDDDWEY